MADKPIETQEPATEAETGVALQGDYPHNHRLRAEALSAAGETSDPDGLISDDLIADAGERVKRLEAAEKAAKTELRTMSKAQLEETASNEGVDLSGASNNGDRAALIEAAREAATSNQTAGDAGEGEGA